MGTPAQSLRTIIDTGSSDIWVNVKTSKFCQEGNCLFGGAYDLNSRSKVLLSDKFDGDYGENHDHVSGQYVKDSIYFDHRVVSNVQFGVALTSNTDIGTFGIGYPANQAQPSGSTKGPYTSFAEELINNKLIKINAFSMWLEADHIGTILFGGVDRARYHDKLKSVPILPYDGTPPVYVEFHILLRELAFSQEETITKLASSQKTLPSRVLLDSGTNVIFLPPTLLDDIFNILDAFNPPDANPLVDCKFLESTLTFDFTFDSTVIKIPVGSLIEQWDGITQEGTTRKLCELRLIANDHDFILGTPFLRNTYVVYNLKDNEISLALVKQGAIASDIIEISPNEADVSDSASPTDSESFNTPNDGSTNLASAAINNPTDGTPPPTDLTPQIPEIADNSQNVFDTQGTTKSLNDNTVDDFTDAET